MNTVNIRLTILAVAILLTIAIGYSLSFRNDIPVCTGYITNVYLYTLLGILLIGISVSFLAKTNFAITSTKGLITLIIAVIITYGFYTIPAASVITNHLTWLAIIALLAISGYSYWRHSSYRGVVSSIYTNILILAMGMSYFAYNSRDLNFTPGNMIVAATVFAALIFTNKWSIGVYTTNGEKALVLFISLLITGLLLHNFSRLKMKGSNCSYPDYPKDSMENFAKYF